VAALSAGLMLQFPLKCKGLLGPDSPPPSHFQAARLTWPAFRDSTRDNADFIETQGRVPSRVFIGPDAVPPAEFLVAMAAAYQSYKTSGKLPLEDGVNIGDEPEILPARHIAKDTPELFGDWIIHREGFRAPNVLEQARLQAWTLKPAFVR
jgi:hypothetical protein